MRERPRGFGVKREEKGVLGGRADREGQRGICVVPGGGLLAGEAEGGAGGAAPQLAAHPGPPRPSGAGRGQREAVPGAPHNNSNNTAAPPFASCSETQALPRTRSPSRARSKLGPAATDPSSRRGDPEMRGRRPPAGPV